jgi:hypothetical protein
MQPELFPAISIDDIFAAYHDCRKHNDSYSCRVGKGTHFGIARVHRFCRRCSQSGGVCAWVLKIDIRGYFMHINRNILFTKLSLFIDKQYHAPDKEQITELCRLIIFNDPTENCIRHSPPEAWRGLPADKSLFSAAKNCGLPIGNLTSQIFANFYLNEFDHFIKNQCGMRFYGRYVDDCVIIHQSKGFLVSLIEKLQHYLMSELGLTLHPKKIYLQPCGHGVKFLGCFIKPSHIVVHHRTVTNFTRSLRMHNALALDHKPDRQEFAAFISSVNSYLGIMKHYKTYRKRQAVLHNNISPFWYKHVDLSEGCCKIQRKR